MITIVRGIRERAVAMRDVTSRNDPHRQKLQEIVDFCDKLSEHFIGDGR